MNKMNRENVLYFFKLFHKSNIQANIETVFIFSAFRMPGQIKKLSIELCTRFNDTVTRRMNNQSSLLSWKK